MARPKKQTVDYFPHEAKSGKTLFILESHWGNDGYAFWFKLLETLCTTNGHILDLNSKTNKEYFLAKVRLDEAKAMEILNTLSELGNIDFELWKQQKIWAQALVDNIQHAYKKRSIELPKRPNDELILSSNELILSSSEDQKKTEKTVSDTGNPVSVTGNPVSVTGNPQSILKDSKVNKSIHNVFYELWEIYPNKVGKTKAFEKFQKSVVSLEDVQNIQKALDVYVKHLAANDWKKPQDGKTWFNSWRDWIDFIEPIKPRGGQNGGKSKPTVERGAAAPDYGTFSKTG